MGRTRNFHRFLLLWAGELASSIGSGLTSFGLGVYVFRQTGSAADMALVSLLAFRPTLLLSVPAGVSVWPEAPDIWCRPFSREYC